MPIYQATIALATDEHKYTQIKAKPYLTADKTILRHSGGGRNPGGVQFHECTFNKPS